MHTTSNNFFLSNALKKHFNEVLFSIYVAGEVKGITNKHIFFLSISVANFLQSRIPNNLLSSKQGSNKNNFFLIIQPINPLTTLVLLTGCELLGINAIVAGNKQIINLNKALENAFATVRNGREVKAYFQGKKVKLYLAFGKAMVQEIKAFKKKELKPTLKNIRRNSRNNKQAATLLQSKENVEILNLEEIEKHLYKEFLALAKNCSNSQSNSQSFYNKLKQLKKKRPLPKLMFFTSGTSNKDAVGKLVVYEYKNIFEAVKKQSAAVGFKKKSKWALNLPLHHVAGLSIIFRATFCGGEVFYRHKASNLKNSSNFFSKEYCLKISNSILQIFLSSGVYYLSLVTPQIAGLNSKLLSKFSLILLGGGSILNSHWQIVKNCKKYFFSNFGVAPTYGLSETFAQLATWRPWLNFGSYAVLPGTQVAIINNKIAFSLNAIQKNNNLLQGCFLSGYLINGKVQLSAVKIKKSLVNKNSNYKVENKISTIYKGQLQKKKTNANTSTSYFVTEDVGLVRNLKTVEKIRLIKHGLLFLFVKGLNFLFSKNIQIPKPFLSKVLEVKGRESAWVISGGENIYLPHLEAVFLKYNVARFVCFFSAANNKWGQALQCFIVPTDEWQKKLSSKKIYENKLSSKKTKSAYKTKTTDKTKSTYKEAEDTHISATGFANDNNKTKAAQNGFTISDSHLGLVTFSAQFVRQQEVLAYVALLKKKALQQNANFAWPKHIFLGNNTLLNEYEKINGLALQHKPAREAIKAFLNQYYKNSFK